MFWSSFSIFALCLISESITSWIVIRRSKIKYPSLWKHAGKPTLIGNGDMISAFPLVNYIAYRRYAHLPEEEAVRFADNIRLPFVVSYYAACLSAAIFLAVFLIYGTNS